MRKYLTLIAGITDDQVVPSARYTRSKSRNLVASPENASELQVSGAYNIRKQKKTGNKINHPLTTSLISETVGKIYNSSSSSTVSFKVPNNDVNESSRATKTDYENTKGTPEETEVFDVSAKRCNSATRRKVNHWFTEQCLSPSSLAEPVSGIETSNRMKNKVKRDVEENSEKEEDAIKDDPGTKASERSPVKFRRSARSNDRKKRLNGGLGAHSDHILIDSDDSSVASGPVQRLIRHRTCRLESTTMATLKQRNRSGERDNHSLANDQPKDTKVNKLSYLRGTPPSRFKTEVSSPGSDDPYSFKASPRTPPVKGKNKARARGRKASFLKKASVLKQKISEGDQNHQGTKLKGEKEKTERKIRY